MRASVGNPTREAQALEQISKLQALAAARVANTFLTSEAAATFKVIVNPLVTWMWIGGLIALAGALIALWPSRGRRRGALVRTEADARKEAKYREIRDAELDHATGKLSDEDFALLDAELRREALEILDREPIGLEAHASLTSLHLPSHVIQVVIAIVLIFLVLLHSGKDAGLSGAFGIGGAGGSGIGGGSMVEQNLDRATVFFAVLFVLNTFLLLKI